MLFDQTILATASAVPAPITIAQATGLGGDDIFAASSALTGTAYVPGMVRPFQDHQGAAFNYALDSIARWGGVLLGDDMGLGKTQVMLALMSTRPGYNIVVAPPVAIAGYRGDLAAAFPHLRFVHLKGRTVTTPAPADIYFLSDDSLTMKAWLTDTHVNPNNGKAFLVASSFAAGAASFTRDEIHRDKGNQGKPTARAKVTMAVADSMRSQGKPIVCATGTLLTNRPVEAYLPLQIVGGEKLVVAVTPGARKASAFLFRYCNPSGQARNQGGFGISFNGIDIDACNDLHEYLRRTVYVRREKSALGDVLPHSGWIIKPIALPGSSLTRYTRIEKEFLDVIREEKGVEAAWRSARAETITRMSAMWEEAGVAKAAASVDYIIDLVEQGKQVVAFYYHQRTFEALGIGLAKAGISIGIVNGKVTGPNRDEAIADFQGGHTQVLLAQIKAAGMAVTLTAASDAVFVQVPWSAGDLKQAADRILRVDQITRDKAIAGDSITWHVLQACREDGTSTFDAAMWSVLETKAHVCDAVNAGRAITMPEESVMRQALEAWYPAAAAANKLSWTK